MSTDIQEMTEEEIRETRDSVDALTPWPRLDALVAFAKDVFARKGVSRKDWQLAPIWAEKLRYTYAQVQELIYPELAAAMGNVLPIDTSPDPSDIEWEYYQVDHAGYADFISEEGDVAPAGALSARRFTGKMHEIGHKYSANVFDIERFAKIKTPNISFVATLQNSAKKAHERTTNWVWLFGDKARGLHGFMNHPNVPVLIAPQNAGATSRLWPNKANDEILADIFTVLDSIPDNTKRQYHAKTLWCSLGMWRELRNRRLGTTDGSTTSLLDYVRNLYSGDDSGQGKVEFKILNECGANFRTHYKDNVDSSGLVGDVMIAMADLPKTDACFIKARPYTTLKPQERDFKMTTLTHSKIGGCLLRDPLAVVRMDFGLT